MARHEEFHVGLGGAVAFVSLHEHLVHALRVEVADRPLDDACLFPDEAGRRAFQGLVPEVLPLLEEAVVVAANLRARSVLTCGADDEAHAFGNVEARSNFLETAALCLIRDLARDAAATGRVGHQHAVASGNRQIGAECGPLGAAFLLGDLNQQNLVFPDHLLDAVAPLEDGRMEDRFRMILAIILLATASSPCRRGA